MALDVSKTLNGCPCCRLSPAEPIRPILKVATGVASEVFDSVYFKVFIPAGKYMHGEEEEVDKAWGVEGGRSDLVFGYSSFCHQNITTPYHRSNRTSTAQAPRQGG